MGRARSDRDLDEHAVGDRRRLDDAALSPRDFAAVGSRTSARRRSCGTAGRVARWATRSSGRTPARTPHRLAHRRRRCRPVLRHDRPSSGHLLLGIQDRLDPRERPRRPCRCRSGPLLFGTPDTWVIWNLTADTRGGIHVTDVTNASRTLLMDLETLAGPTSCSRCSASRGRCCPRSCRHRGRRRGREPPAARGIPIAGILGDQQAATFGQAAFERGSRRTRTAPATSCS
jgi:glycerol kinase